MSQPTMPETAENVAPPTDAGSSSSVERMVEVITSPMATMRSIAARPDILVPMLTVLVLASLTSWLMAPRVDVRADVRAAAAAHDFPPEMVEQQIAVSEKIKDFSYFLGPVVVGMIVVVVAGGFLFAFRIMGGAGTFSQALAIVLYARMPAVLRDVVMTGLVLARDEPVRASSLKTVLFTNLGFLFDPLQSPAAFALASSVDLVVIWMLFLMGVGFSFASGFSRAKSMTIVFTIWAVVLLGRTGIAALTSSMG